MFPILKKSLKTGVVTGQYPKAEASQEPVSPEAPKETRPFRRSLAIREVVSGFCNACEMEMNALANPVYDVERFGVDIVASPRHADALVVTGPATVNMERVLTDVYEQTPDPKIVIALGDCAINCGFFKGSYAVTGPVECHIPVDVRIPGCPPRPAEILNALQELRAQKDRDGDRASLSMTHPSSSRPIACCGSEPFPICQ